MKFKMMYHDDKPVCCLTAETADEAFMLSVAATRFGWSTLPAVEKGAKVHLDVENLLAQCKPCPGMSTGKAPEKTEPGTGNPPEMAPDAGGQADANGGQG